MTWIKTQFKRFKKWIIFSVLGGTALAAGIATIDNIPDRVQAMDINGKSVSVNYTDDNTNEDLIIHSDSKNYFGIGYVGVIVSVYNTGKSQNVKFAVSTPSKEGWDIVKVESYSGEEDVIIAGTPEIITATGTIPAVPDKTIKKTTWNNVGTKAFQNPNINRKLTKEKTDKESNPFFVAKGETKFFKITIKYSSFEEFFIEAFGDQGGYGNLDPWTVEDLFNSDTKSTGDLNGQDGWSGSVCYDIQGSVFYEGDQAVKGTSCNANMELSITAVSSGTLYVALRKDTQNRDGSFFLETNTGANNWMYITFNGSNLVVSNGAGEDTLISGFTTSQFYLFEIEIVGTSSYKIRYHNGTSWSTQTSAKTAINTGSVDSIRLSMGSGNPPATGDMYWDTITPTNPKPDAVRGEEFIIIFE